MKWRLRDNRPARAVLNRSSVWTEWDRRPQSGFVGIRTARKRSASTGGDGQKGKQSRPSSFFGFMSMVGGLGSSVKGTTVTPPGSPKR